MSLRSFELGPPRLNEPEFGPGAHFIQMCSPLSSSSLSQFEAHSGGDGGFPALKNSLSLSFVRVRSVGLPEKYTCELIKQREDVKNGVLVHYYKLGSKQVRERLHGWIDFAAAAFD